MASADLKKWNTRYAQTERVFPNPPAALHVAIPYLLAGTTLDVASGEGAVALHLAQSSRFKVTALDISDVGLANLKKFADDKKIHLQTLCLDLDSSDFNQLLCFDNICIYRYKPSVDLILKLSEKLSENGRLVISTFNQRQHIEQGFNERFCLVDNEFANVTNKLQLIKFFRSVKVPYTDTYIWQKI